MSEPKRIALIPLAAAEAAQAPLPAKKDKKSTTTIVKTHRFTLTLPDSTEKSCPEFNFADLISALTVSPCVVLTKFLDFKVIFFNPVTVIREYVALSFSISSFRSSQSLQPSFYYYYYGDFLLIFEHTLCVSVVGKKSFETDSRSPCFCLVSSRREDSGPAQSWRGRFWGPSLPASTLVVSLPSCINQPNFRAAFCSFIERVYDGRMKFILFATRDLRGE